MKQAAKSPPPNAKQGLSVESKNGDNEREILSIDSRVKTLEDALKKAEIDTDIWEVERCTVNSWECYSEQSGTHPLWQVKATLRRKAPKHYTDAMEALCERIKKHAPKYDAPKNRQITDPHLLEVCCFDVHFGKLAWAPESGTNYDLAIAEKVFRNAVEDLVRMATGSFSKIERVLFPVGNDFLHVDGLESATTKGTRVDSDCRYPKIIETASMALVNAIDYLGQVAKVDVLWIPGNHDRLASYHLCRELKAHYSRAKHVSVDVTPPTRKYYEYGATLLGFAHGDKEPLNKLPHVMATERPEAWARTSHHEFHTGDKHHRKCRDTMSVDEHNGTVVRIIPALSGTDAWHYDHLYTKSSRAAEAYLWSRTRGYSGHFSAGARE